MRNLKNQSYTFIAGRPFCDKLLNVAWVTFVLSAALVLLSLFSLPQSSKTIVLLLGLNGLGMALTTFWFSYEVALMDSLENRTKMKAM